MGENLQKIKDKLWSISFLSIISNTIFIISIIFFVGYFVFSFQNMRIIVANYFLGFNIYISLISLILSFISLIVVIFYKRRFLVKISFIIKQLLKIFLSLAFFLILNSIYVMTLGTVR